jgi:choline kinase
MFHYINEKKLMTSSDYENPDFIPLIQPSDSIYEQSYSQDSPSVHDLFDIDVDFPADYEMIEEYIVDEET